MFAVPRQWLRFLEVFKGICASGPIRRECLWSNSYDTSFVSSEISEGDVLQRIFSREYFHPVVQCEIHGISWVAGPFWKFLSKNICILSWDSVGLGRSWILSGSLIPWFSFSSWVPRGFLGSFTFARFSWCSWCSIFFGFGSWIFLVFVEFLGCIFFLDYSGVLLAIVSVLSASLIDMSCCWQKQSSM